MRSAHIKKVMTIFIIGIFLMQLLIPAKPSEAATTTTTTSSAITASFDKNAYYNQIGQMITVVANKYNIPPALLKAIAWMESGWYQYQHDSSGQPLTDQPLIGRDGVGIGIMQISTYDPNDTAEVNKLKTDIEYNLEQGAIILNQKWRAYPKIGNGDRNVLENWYFAVWGYSGWGSKNNPNILAGKSNAYQNTIFALLGQKYNSAITFAPGATIISKSLLPATGAPSINSLWSTPTPTHTGDLTIDQTNLLSTGGGTDATSAANGDYWYNYARWGSYYALGFYNTAYDSSTITDKSLVTQKITSAYNNLLDEADSLLLAGTDTSYATAAKYYWTVLQGPNLDAGLTERATLGLQKAQQAAPQPTPEPPAPPQPVITTSRLGGFDQYETAAKIAEQGWSSTSDNAILAPGTQANMVDALAAGPLAAKLNAPILLTEGDQLNTYAKAELSRLQVKNVYVVSGTAVIKPSVLSEVKAISSGINIIPLGGYTQYDTAINIAKQMGNFTKIAVATGNQAITPADALSVSSIAGAQGMPIILTDKKQLPSSVAAYLNSIKGNIIESDIIGGTGVISDTVKGQLPGTVNRYWGNTAYDTNLAVLKAFDSVIHYDHVYLANGETAIDALAGAPLAAKYNAAIVLTNLTTNAGTTYVSNKLPAICEVTALGGLTVVPDVVLNATANKTLGAD